jgi:hypothetical protein
MENQYRDYVYVNWAGTVRYSYKEDLDITMSWLDNFLILLALSAMFYIASFMLLIRTIKQVSV